MLFVCQTAFLFIKFLIIFSPLNGTKTTIKQFSDSKISYRVSLTRKADPDSPSLFKFVVEPVTTVSVQYKISIASNLNAQMELISPGELIKKTIKFQTQHQYYIPKKKLKGVEDLTIRFRGIFDQTLERTIIPNLEIYDLESLKKDAKATKINFEVNDAKNHKGSKDVTFKASKIQKILLIKLACPQFQFTETNFEFTVIINNYEVVPVDHFYEYKLNGQEDIKLELQSPPHSQVVQITGHSCSGGIDYYYSFRGTKFTDINLLKRFKPKSPGVHHSTWTLRKREALYLKIVGTDLQNPSDFVMSTNLVDERNYFHLKPEEVFVDYRISYKGWSEDDDELHFKVTPPRVLKDIRRLIANAVFIRVNLIAVVSPDKAYLDKIVCPEQQYTEKKRNDKELESSTSYFRYTIDKQNEFNSRTNRTIDNSISIKRPASSVITGKLYYKLFVVINVSGPGYVSLSKLRLSTKAYSTYFAKTKFVKSWNKKGVFILVGILALVVGFWCWFKRKHKDMVNSKDKKQYGETGNSVTHVGALELV